MLFHKPQTLPTTILYWNPFKSQSLHVFQKFFPWKSSSPRLIFKQAKAQKLLSKDVLGFPWHICSIYVFAVVDNQKKICNKRFDMFEQEYKSIQVVRKYFQIFWLLHFAKLSFFYFGCLHFISKRKKFECWLLIVSSNASPQSMLNASFHVSVIGQ